MMLMGDEVRRTQLGNNNAYCQDNELSWFDWSMVEQHADLLRFVRLLILCRLHRDVPPDEHRLTLNEILREARIEWHGVRLNAPDWGDNSHCLAMSAQARKNDVLFHFMFNFHWEPHDFQLPSLSARLERFWRRWIDTSLHSPHDICRWDEAIAVQGTSYRVQPRSIAVLLGHEPRSRAVIACFGKSEAERPLTPQFHFRSVLRLRLRLRLQYCAPSARSPVFLGWHTFVKIPQQHLRNRFHLAITASHSRQF